MELPSTGQAAKFNKQLSLQFNDGRGQVIADFEVDIHNNLVSPVAITYMPERVSEVARPVIVRAPKQLIEQLNTFPIEMSGIPIDVMIRIANAIHVGKGTSVIEAIRRQGADELLDGSL